ncbi:WD40_repeat protein [Hexamita inflata]|uniref:WD40 repeat protein n=1 Tax=Hexamita inflata TaxID=28002 RepID=A0AA86PLJ7_9EUKA|nr:WD40 repeat protein [Hexamita inflata]
MLCVQTPAQSYVLHPKTLQILYTSQSEDGAQNSAYFQPSGFVSIRKRAQDIHLFNYNSATARFRITFQHQFTACFAQDQTTILGTSTGLILIFSSGELVKTASPHCRPVLGITVLQNKILSWSEDGSFKLLNFNGSIIAQNQQHGLCVNAVQFQNNCFFSVGRDKSIKISQLTEKTDKMDFKTICEKKTSEELLFLGLNCQYAVAADSHKVFAFDFNLNQTELYTSESEITGLGVSEVSNDIYIGTKTKLVMIKSGGGVQECNIQQAANVQVFFNKFDMQAVMFKKGLNRIEATEVVDIERKHIVLQGKIQCGINKNYVKQFKLHTKSNDDDSTVVKMLREIAQREIELF